MGQNTLFTLFSLPQYLHPSLSTSFPPSVPPSLPQYLHPHQFLSFLPFVLYFSNSHLLPALKAASRPLKNASTTIEQKQLLGVRLGDHATKGINRLMLNGFVSITPNPTPPCYCCCCWLLLLLMVVVVKCSVIFPITKTTLTMTKK